MLIIELKVQNNVLRITFPIRNGSLTKVTKVNYFREYSVLNIRFLINQDNLKKKKILSY